jgi:hypothetical protein
MITYYFERKHHHGEQSFIDDKTAIQALTGMYRDLLVIYKVSAGYNEAFLDMYAIDR